MPTVVDNNMMGAIDGDLRAVHAQVSECASRLFGARTMTKSERHDLARRLNSANVKVNTVLKRLGRELR